MATTDHLDLKLSSTDNQLLQQAAAIEGIFDPKRHDRSAFACGEPTLDAL
jgi:uncharacterized protein (DUF1778 family)